MEITMMSRWNTPCGVSLHAEFLGRALIECGYKVRILAPFELHEEHQLSDDEPYVTRCYRLPFYDKQRFFDAKPFLEDKSNIFVVQNLEISPMEDLLKVYPKIKEHAKTVLVVHEGKPPKESIFYKFEFDAVVCFYDGYKEFLCKIYPEEKIKVIPYPCHPIKRGDKEEARRRLNLPHDKKIIFNYGIGVYRHLHLLPTIERVSKKYPLLLLTLTHIQDWFDLFSAVKGRYDFIELRPGKVETEELYTYLHASDCLLIHKDSSEAVVVPSTAFLCLGSCIPILAYDTNFFASVGEEVLKYRGPGELEELLGDVFEGGERTKLTLQKAEEYVRKNSAQQIAKKFISLFESLLKENE
jgi:glycosyltransferase involved in cell wall biosynthesis